MIVLNFSRQLPKEKRRQLAALLQQLGLPEVEKSIDIATEFDVDESFAEQTVTLVDAVGLTEREWREKPICVFLPGMNVIGATVLVEMHARMGRFPYIARTRGVPNSVPPKYEVVEVIDLERHWKERKKEFSNLECEVVAC